MGVHSKTGLLPTNKSCTIHYQQKPKISLIAIAVPAPYTLKPFAGLYNPFPYGCSLLCNHPADHEAKDLLKKAKDTWATEGKSLLLAEEVAAIRAGLDQLQTLDSNDRTPPHVFEAADNISSSVPEELFRRYTETDSRPLTPAPTIVSNYTRTSASRRCLTPDPIPSQVKEKTQLILDLRRSHSQETLSWYGGFGSSETPIIRIQQAPTSSPDVSNVDLARRSPRFVKPKQPPRSAIMQKPKDVMMKLRPESARPKSVLKTEPKIEVTPPKIEIGDHENASEEDDSGEEDEATMKRRGKKRHKKGRDSSRGPPAVQSSIDPETQIAAIGIDSHNPSARPSLVSNLDAEDILTPKPVEERKTSLDVNSFLGRDVLKQLRRELDEEVVDNEFNYKRRKALEEAMKTVTKNKIECEELKKLHRELRVPSVNADFLLSLPRNFSRSSARFELPPDSRMFSSMTPIDYIKDNIKIGSARKLLYNCVFNRNKIEHELEEEQLRDISGKSMKKALSEMMGREFTEKQYNDFRDLVGWSDMDVFNFKTFCGICALCERVLAPAFNPLLPTKREDPCHEIEVADFESLERRLQNQNPDRRLLEIMYAIRDS